MLSSSLFKLLFKNNKSNSITSKKNKEDSNVENSFLASSILRVKFLAY